MRSYPPNSPEAAARIVALVLVSDGHACPSEFALLKQLGAEPALGLEPQLLPHIVYTLHEELRLRGYMAGSPLDCLDDASLASLLAEISDPDLRKTVLRLSLAAAEADGQLDAGEARMVEALRQHWRPVDEAAPAARRKRRRLSSLMSSVQAEKTKA